MAGPFLSHDVHDLGYGVMAGAAANIPGHQITDFLRQDIRSAAGKRAYDVALGYDAVDRVIAVHHQKGANPALGQDVDGLGDRLIGSDSYDVDPLRLMTAATCIRTAPLCRRSPVRRPFEGA